MRLSATLILLVFLIVGCKSQKQIEYSFFIAGHAYGNPMKDRSGGLYKPFKDKISFLNSQKNMKRGLLLGDVVWGQQFWPKTFDDISKFSMPIDVVRGNHDGRNNFFYKTFGKSYKYFFIESDLFIILDLNHNGWNVTGDQLTFLKEAINVEGKNANNIFVFSHQVIWYTPEDFLYPVPNSLYQRSEATNYWTEIEPLFQSVKKPIYVFAGDVGAFSKEKRKENYIIEYSYYKVNGISYISSGMGGGVRDNIVIIDVYNDNSVEYRLISLNGDDMNSLGKLKDYINPN